MVTAPSWLRAQKRSVTVGRLRREHPDWTWTAKQYHFGSWTYHGCRKSDGARVTVASRFTIHGPEDASSVTWWVYGHDDYSGSYWGWAGT